MKKTFFLLGAFALFILLPTSVFAGVRCETQYGGGETCIRTGEVQIDKKVWTAADGLWVDNTGPNRPFKVGEEVLFKLRIKNVGDETLNNVRVTDSLPAYLTHVAGELNFNLGSLAPGQAHERDIRAKVVSQLPIDQGLICDNRTTNVAEVNADGGKHDKDSAQVCVDHRVKGVTPTPVVGKGKGIPKTGPELLLGLLPIIGGAGYLIKNKFKKGHFLKKQLRRG